MIKCAWNWRFKARDKFRSPATCLSSKTARQKRDPVLSGSTWSALSEHLPLPLSPTAPLLENTTHGCPMSINIAGTMASGLSLARFVRLLPASSSAEKPRASV